MLLVDKCRSVWQGGLATAGDGGGPGRPGSLGRRGDVVPAGVSVEVRVGAVLLDAAAPFDALGDVAGSARHAERADLDSLWAGDHLLLGDTRCWTAP